MTTATTTTTWTARYEAAPAATDHYVAGDAKEVYEEWRRALACRLLALPCHEAWGEPCVEHDAWSTYVDWTSEWVDEDGDQVEESVRVRLSNHPGRERQRGRIVAECRLGSRDGRDHDTEGDRAAETLATLLARPPWEAR